MDIVACFNDSSFCVIEPACLLKGALAEARDAFLAAKTRTLAFEQPVAREARNDPPANDRDQEDGRAECETPPEARGHGYTERFEVHQQISGDEERERGCHRQVTPVAAGGEKHRAESVIQHRRQPCAAEALRAAWRGRRAYSGPAMISRAATARRQMGNARSAKSANHAGRSAEIRQASRPSSQRQASAASG